MQSTITIRQRSARLALLLRSLCFAGLVLGLASAAQARVETISWMHDTPSEVSGFYVYVGPAEGNYLDNIDAQLPARVNGRYTFDLTVPDDATIWIAVSAYRPGEESGLSNAISRSAPNTDPPVTDPPVTDPPSTDPPVAGDALFFEDFDTAATGTFVPGWVDTKAWDSMEVDDSLFSVVTISGNSVLTTSSEDGNIHSHFLDGGSADWSSYEVRGRMRVVQPDGSIGVTAYSHYNQQDVYYRLGRFQSGAFEISWHPLEATAGRSCAQGSTGVTPLPNVWYRFRLVVFPEASGTTLLAKVWAGALAEPSDWQAECFDANPNRPTAGTIGLWSFQNGAKYWDDLEVISLSEPPPGMPPVAELGPPGQPFLLQ